MKKTNKPKGRPLSVRQKPYESIFPVSSVEEAVAKLEKRHNIQEKPLPPNPGKCQWCDGACGSEFLLYHAVAGWISLSCEELYQFMKEQIESDHS